MNNNVTSARRLRLGIAGLGTIGLAVARRVDAGEAGDMVVSAVSARDTGKAADNISGFTHRPDIVPIGEIGGHCDVVLECAPRSVFDELATSAISNGCIFIPLSVGALLDRPELVEQARATGAKIMVPTGALIGLDAVKAIAQGNVTSITMETRKPPRGLKGAPHIAATGVDLDSVSEPLKVFSGTAREAARGFPANVNVAAALGLAGIGPDRTMVEIWADPTVQHNTHSITAKSDSSDFTMTIQNIPTAENPPTGKITALSALATLQRLTSPLVVGT
ncbi:aspartate dehydrogenase [Anderseniella sp. Alg231-50]|uniref:aspartate dehydrogenase n=1 Tax=Anderseniella sp. Alg231-50 TaxID=1922226 RepID=UPI000D553D8F